MRIEFIERFGEEGIVAEVEIYFEDDMPEPFAGKKLVGTQLRKGSHGKLYVNLPGRAFGAGIKRQYFEFLRDEDEKHGRLDDVKKYILEAYEDSEPVEEE
jgi:hypothetical protein